MRSLFLALAAFAAADACGADGASDAVTTAALSEAVQAAPDRLDQEQDSGVRRAIVEQAEREAAACLARRPETAPCQYAQAIVLGLDAREHPLHFRSFLTRMLVTLTRVEELDPNYDFAGAARTQAQVLTRAPGWPLGPGDVRAALAAAQRAVATQPAYPANWLALGEAQAKLGAKSDAHASYARARALAQPMPPSRDREAWLHEARQGLEAH
jgi:tetratricopeptide (TPR) repeat protein